ncbi:MAG: type II secretion system F family protein [Cytophagales bacterium]|nr:type II secretion system F family protein [Cytophagales bacterium]
MKLEDFSIPVEAAEKPEKESIWNRDISFGGNKLTDKHKATFYHQLRTLVSSGVDIRSSLELVRDQFKSKKSIAIIQQIIDELIRGKSLSGSFDSSGKFTNYEIFSLRIGEESGRLVEVLDTLAGYYDQKLEQSRQLVNALSYPVLIILSAVGAISFMMLTIIPMFEEVFKRFGSELPALTKTIIGFSGFINTNIWLILFAIVLFIVAIVVLRKNARFNFAMEAIMMKFPYIGQLYMDIQLSRCSASLALLTNASVPLTRALDFVSQMMTMQHLQDALERVGKQIVRGRQLHEALAQETIFDKSFVSLIRVGEEVNKLGEFFDKLSVEYANNASYRTKQLNTVLEPVMIVFLGLMVGIILIAMYLPMFQLSTSMEIN